MMERALILCWVAVALLGAALMPRWAHAWGDEGHEIVALIADHYLDAPVRAKVQALLLTDQTGLVPDTSMTTESIWADRYRESDRHRGSDLHGPLYEETRRWHYVDIELASPNLASACFDHPRLPAGTRASAGPATACVVDKIEQFEAELKNRRAPADERRLALQFLLHFIGDLHQPLHASDDEDEGGNLKRVSAEGFRNGNLHRYWDTDFVSALGTEPQQVAAKLIAHISAS